MNHSVVGKDGNNRIWFKSDWCLTDITGAVNFYVQDESFLWSKWLRIFATVPYNKSLHGTVKNSQGHVYEPALYNVTIGWYNTIQQASMAMEQLMPLLGILEINPLDGLPYMRK